MSATLVHVRTAERLLGRHVVRRADDHAGRGQRLVAPRPSSRCRSPRAPRARCRVQQDVGGLDVAMHHAVTVRALQRAGELREHAPRLAVRKPSLDRRRRSASDSPRTYPITKYQTPPTSPKVCSGTMPGCESCAATRASRRNRSRPASASARSGRSTLIATYRSSAARARGTPRPSRRGRAAAGSRMRSAQRPREQRAQARWRRRRRGGRARRRRRPPGHARRPAATRPRDGAPSSAPHASLTYACRSPLGGAPALVPRIAFTSCQRSGGHASPELAAEPRAGDGPLALHRRRRDAHAPRRSPRS